MLTPCAANPPTMTGFWRRVRRLIMLRLVWRILPIETQKTPNFSSGVDTERLTAVQAAGGLVQRGELVASESGVFWLESDPVSGLNLIHTTVDSPNGSASLSKLVTKKTLGVRSQVNGYGGGALCAAPHRLFAVEASSQQVHTISPETGHYEQITSDPGARYGGLVWDLAGDRLLAVREYSDRQQLVFFQNGRPQVLHEGEDFYSAPAVSDNGRQLAWFSWHLPDMPWVASVLWLASIGDNGLPVDARQIPVSPLASSTGCVQQPVFVGETLYVLSDHDGWWQPWELTGKSEWRCLDNTQVDQASAPWQLGESHHVALSEGGWVRVRYCAGVGELWWQPNASADPLRLAKQYMDFRYLRLQGTHVFCIARAADRLDSVLAVDSETGQIRCLAGGEQPFGKVVLSTPEPFRIPAAGQDGLSLSGFYYAPVHSSSDQEMPPPMVMIAHGGPTSMVCPVLNPQIQFLCHQGFAVAEVNYRGSSGFGRDFRLSLAGQWGLFDVQDMERAARHLVNFGKASSRCVFIQGRSSGGYTALMTLVLSGYFTAGVSQFGVSDPERLRRRTHRFESGYLDWLLGPLDQVPHQWEQRSPLAQASRIRRPMAFFQGGQDAVVVPEQTQNMAEAIRANGQQPLVRVYPDEGHGFRKAANQTDMLQRLADFYRQHC